MIVGCMKKLMSSVGKLLLLVMVVISGEGCSNGFSKPDIKRSSNDNGEMNKKIDLELTSIHPFSAYDTLLLSELHQYYLLKSRTLWISEGHLSQQALEVRQLLNNSYLYGLLNGWYQIPLSFNGVADTTELIGKDVNYLIKEDILFSWSLMRFLMHLNIGIAHSKESTPDSVAVNKIMKSFIALSEGNNPRTVLSGLEPVMPFYQQLKQQLPYFSIFFNHFLIGSSNPDDKEKLAIWKLMQLSGFYRHVNSFNDKEFELLIATWQKYNHLNSDGKFSFETRKALLNQAMDLCGKISLNIERIRHNPPNRSDYLWVNIPAFMLYACHDSVVKEQWKVIVGKPKTPTPIITSYMSHVLTYPPWNIPPSIVIGEVIPEMKKDSLYLQKKGYVITNWSGNRLNPSLVSIFSYSLSSNPYNIMQPPGEDNALGILKFLFDNDNTVYIHDTNSRSLFSRNYRAFSHGCIRVNDPYRLAHYLLNDNQEEIMYSQLRSKRTGHIKINKEIGVCIRYLTCGFDNQGNIIFYPDLYNRDAGELLATGLRFN